MADNRDWVKWWTSILDDAKFQNIRLEDVGLYALLLAMVGRQGDRGKLLISPPALVPCAMLRSTTVDTLKIALNRLPNVQLTPPVNDNGDFYVIISRWFTYQIDFTQAKRTKMSRNKNRKLITLQDKIREVKTLTSKSTSTSLPASRLGALPGGTPPALAGKTEESWKATDPESEPRMTKAEMEEIRIRNKCP